MNLATIAARNVVRNPVRLVLSVAGITIALIAFVALHTAVRSYEEAQNYARRDRIVTRNKVTFVMPLPLRFVEQVRGLQSADGTPMLRATSYMNWFGGKDPNRPTEFFQTLAADHETIFEVYDELAVDDAAREAFASTRDAAIIGAGIANKFGWEVGSRIGLDSPIYPAPPDRPWSLQVVGIYTSESKALDEQTLFFRWDYLNDNAPEPMRGTVGWISSRAGDPERALEAAAAIDALFEDAEVQTLSQDERTFFTSFIGMVATVLNLMSVLSYVILAILGLILGNAIAMGVRERTNEYAAMKAIGFSGRQVAGMILAESTLAALAGAVPGVAIAWLIVDRGLGDAIEQNLTQIFPMFSVVPTTLVTAGAAAVLLGLLAGVVPAVGAARLNVIENLRRVA